MATKSPPCAIRHPWRWCAGAIQSGGVLPLFCHSLQLRSCANLATQGIGAFVRGKEWKPNSCHTYLHTPLPADEAEAYIKMAVQIEGRVDHVSASVYTQTTDLELECDGATHLTHARSLVGTAYPYTYCLRPRLEYPQCRCPVAAHSKICLRWSCQALLLI